MRFIEEDQIFLKRISSNPCRSAALEDNPRNMDRTYCWDDTRKYKRKREGGKPRYKDHRKL